MATSARKPEHKLNDDGTLTCRVCSAPKELSEFYRNHLNKLGVEGLCKTCSSVKSAAWRANKSQSRNKGPDYAEKMAARRMRRDHAEKLEESDLGYGWRNALIKFYDHKCLKCGSRKKLHADHVVALSRGGSHRSENLQVLCQFCNLSKHDKTADYRAGKIFKW